MIQSMTGFGKAEKQFENKNYVLELRSLNSKGLEVNLRMPLQVREIEIELKKIIGEHLVRGKIDLNLNIENLGLPSVKTINPSAINHYIDQLKDIEDGNRMELLKMAIKLPETLTTGKKEFEAEEIQMIKELLKQVIGTLNQFRGDEGKVLETEFQKRLFNIERLAGDVEEIDPVRSANITKKLKASLESLQFEVDQNRFEQELIYYVEKYDITEEKVRLKNHIDYFKETMDQSSSNGKKLGFITQEMGREINTIGSKANHAGLQKLVIQMKDELEKIKEQLLNVL
ncbi:MAG: YicC family protein [Flavobacteriaceae bacterium]|nr:YicC family protein [Flavobacteriaceae bacterium]|tara:strand:- start:1115 stop:1972 length:858 start_codon:yes stop_codon:yes gene_type:complete